MSDIWSPGTDNLLRVTGSVVTIEEGRPSLIAVSLDSEAPARRYGLDARTAFEVAHGMALLSLRLEPKLIGELRARMLEEAGKG
jgi:hypothetical protein